MPSELRANNKATRAARQAPIVPRAADDADAADDAAEPAKKEESNFWKKLFLSEGQEEVSSNDYQKFQAELNAKKAAAKAKAAEKGDCTIM